MKVYVEKVSKHYGEANYEEKELTAELVHELEMQAAKMSRQYSSYVLSMKEENGKIYVYFDGPWEC